MIARDRERFSDGRVAIASGVKPITGFAAPNFGAATDERSVICYTIYHHVLLSNFVREKQSRAVVDVISKFGQSD